MKVNLAVLDQLQRCCQEWWEISHQFYNLHLLYLENESVDGAENDVSFLICRSQVYLAACVGLVAIVTLVTLQDSNLGRIALPNRFKRLLDILDLSYLNQMKLVALILAKMPQSHR